MDTIKYLLIGIPLILGIYIRFAKFEKKSFYLSLLITIAVFSTIGVGYSFHSYKSPPKEIIEWSQVTCSGLIGFIVFIFVYHMTEGFGKALVLAAISFVIGTIIVKDIGKTEYAGLVVGATIVSFFIIAGLVNTILGSIMAGFVLSSAMHSIIFGGGISDIMLFKEFFEFFEINNYIIKVIVLICIGLLSASETLTSMMENS